MDSHQDTFISWLSRKWEIKDCCYGVKSFYSFFSSPGQRCSYILSSFWFILKQQWTIEKMSIFSNSRHLECRAGLSDIIVKGTHHLASVIRRKLSHLNLLWNRWTKLNQTWQGWSLSHLWQFHPPFKMAAVTINRHFFNCPLLLYYKSKWAQILTAATWQWVD